MSDTRASIRIRGDRASARAGRRRAGERASSDDASERASRDGAARSRAPASSGETRRPARWQRACATRHTVSSVPTRASDARVEKAGDARAFEREGERMVRSFEEACAEHVDEPVVWLSCSQMPARAGRREASRRALQRGAAVSAHDREKSGLFVQLLALRELKENRVQSAYRLALIARRLDEDCALYHGGESSEMLRTNAPSFLASRVPP